MNHRERTTSGSWPYDQAAFGEDGYFSNAPLGLRRSATTRDRTATRRVAARQVSRRPRAQTYRRRRRSAGLILPLLILLGSAGGIAWVTLERQGQAPATAQAPDEVPPLVPVSASATTALWTHTDGRGSTIGFTASSLRSDGSAFIVFIPASAMVEIPGYGLDTLARAGDFGGVDLARLAVENLLTIKFDHVVELTPAAMSELTRPFDPVLVQNPGRIDVVNSVDRVEVLYPAGAMLLDSADSADFLARRGIAESDLDRLVRHQEFWESYLLARSESEASSADQDPADRFFDDLAARRLETEFRILDVSLIGGGQELYGVDRDALPVVINLLAPARDINVAPTAVQILNGVGTPGLAAPITERLIGVGASVHLTDNATRFDHDTTQVVYYRDEQFDAAFAIHGALGVGDLVKAVDPIDVVDVTVVVGRDLVATLPLAGSEVRPIVRPAVGNGRESRQNESS